MGRVTRAGRVVFGDASLTIWEDGLKGSLQERDIWESAFKKDVFKRIIQSLNCIGWTCVIPEEKILRYGRSFAESSRYCVKGDLKADLSISGRCIEFRMFQNVNAPDRPDHEGRYQSGKEQHMPYLLRLEMERTRRRIQTYLCNVFSGYEFEPDSSDWRMRECGPGRLTAMMWLEKSYESSHHFKGDLTTYAISDANRRSADGSLLNHGQRVWFSDRKGRIRSGIAYYNINNMWWILLGKYSYTNLASFELMTKAPDNVRQKRNEAIREARLKKLMNDSVAAMQFERAALLRDALCKKKVA